MGAKYDFSGYATRNDVRCSDGRIIRKDAFIENDGQIVPLVWQHMHNTPENVLGHALLENRPDGVYAYCSFNDSEAGQAGKTLVRHGDIKALSIYANKLKQKNGDVTHGLIREVSLVLAGANPEAFIDDISFEHSDDEAFDAVMYFDQDVVVHSDEEEEVDIHDFVESKKAETAEKAEKESEEEEEEVVEHADSADEKGDKDMAEGGKTLKDVFETLNEEQKTMVYALVGAARGDVDEEDDDVKHNVFENDHEDNTLVHMDMDEVLSDAKRLGSLKEAVLQHAEGDIEYSPGTATYGVDGVDFLFPDARNVTNTPTFIRRDTEWVGTVMRGVSHSPFSRIKSIFADITEDEARAKGYIKGHMKKNEVFGLLKRTTTPQTVYKKQKMDRDDVIDITDFDVIAWIKGEMRGMLDEELARAFLVGDGRDASSDDKINEINIRPIWTDEDLFTIKYTLKADTPKEFVRGSVRSRKQYKGSGNPVLFTTEDTLTELLLMEDANERVIYDTEEKLRTALRVSRIITVPVMEDLVRVDGQGKAHALRGIIVNLADYKVGADKGGAVSMFDDFDIDYNQQKYLIETRCSGALVKPYSAIALEVDTEVPEEDDNEGGEGGES